MNVNEVLKKRYGGDRFNPVAGQSQMSFQEWMDRHPSLQGAREGVAYDKYKSATSEKGGQEYLRGAPSIDGPVKPPEMFDKMEQHKGFAAARPNMQQQMGGPDQPPGEAMKRAESGIREFANRSRSEKMMSAAKRRGMTTTGAKGKDGTSSKGQNPQKKPQPKPGQKEGVQRQHPVRGRPLEPKLTPGGNGSKMVNYPARNKQRRPLAR